MRQETRVLNLFTNNNLKQNHMEELTIAMCMATLVQLAISIPALTDHHRQDGMIAMETNETLSGWVHLDVVSLNNIITNKLLNNDETKLT